MCLGHATPLHVVLTNAKARQPTHPPTLLAWHAVPQDDAADAPAATAPPPPLASRLSAVSMMSTEICSHDRNVRSAAGVRERGAGTGEEGGLGQGSGIG